MIRANQIVYNVSNRSVFDIAQTRFQPASNDPVLNNNVKKIEPRGSGPKDMDNMNGVLLAGTPRCYVPDVLDLNRILKPEPLASSYGQFPVSPLKFQPPRASPMPPRFIR